MRAAAKKRVKQLPGSPRYCGDVLNKKLAQLVQLMRVKYVTKEPITKAEILENVTKEHEDHFLQSSNQSLNAWRLSLALGSKEVDPTSHSYVLQKT